MMSVLSLQDLQAMAAESCERDAPDPVFQTPHDVEQFSVATTNKTPSSSELSEATTFITPTIGRTHAHTDDDEALRPIRRRSIRATDPIDLVTTVREASKHTTTARQYTVQDMSDLILDKYTGQKNVLNIVLHWLADEVDFCDTDKLPLLRTFGEIPRPQLCSQLTTFVNKHFTYNRHHIIKGWAKPLGTVFKHSAKSLWPNTHREKEYKQIMRSRKLYGIRMRHRQQSQATTV